jgi:predicted nucleic acid-binding protein
LILLDAYALVAFLGGEPAAHDVRPLFGRDDTAITAVNLAEALDVLVRVRRHHPDDIDAALAPLLATLLRVVPVGEPEARLASALRVRHYHRRTSPLSLADCLVLAGGVSGPASIATSDPPLAAAARKEGVRVIALRDSTGRRP